eukprot:765527-Hanusia_phi.AAC.1
MTAGGGEQRTGSRKTRKSGGDGRGSRRRRRLQLISVQRVLASLGLDTIAEEVRNLEVESPADSLQLDILASIYQSDKHKDQWVDYKVDCFSSSSSSFPPSLLPSFPPFPLPSPYLQTSASVLTVNFCQAFCEEMTSSPSAVRSQLQGLTNLVPILVSSLLLLLLFVALVLSLLLHLLLFVALVSSLLLLAPPPVSSCRVLLLLLLLIPVLLRFLLPDSFLQSFSTPSAENSGPPPPPPPPPPDLGRQRARSRRPRWPPQLLREQGRQQKGHLSPSWAGGLISLANFSDSLRACGVSRIPPPAPSPAGPDLAVVSSDELDALFAHF